MGIVVFGEGTKWGLSTVDFVDWLSAAPPTSISMTGRNKTPRFILLFQLNWPTTPMVKSALRWGSYVVFRARELDPSLPQPGGEAAHVFCHPAVVHHRQLWPPRLLQVSWASPPTVQVGAPFAGPPPGLNTGFWCAALRGETRERESTEAFHY